MKYGISLTDKSVICQSIKEHPKLSIFILMRRLQCTADKALYIMNEYIPTIEMEMKNDGL